MGVGKPYRVALAWQGSASLVIAAVAAVLGGFTGFVSALLGGGVGAAGVLVFALVSSLGGTGNPSAVVRVVLRAEAAKIVVIVLLLWLVLSGFHELVVVAFLPAFIVSVLLSGLTFAVAQD